MVDVVGIRFKTAGKIYYFDPLEFDLTIGDNVIVETARGIEYGTIAIEKRQIEEKDIVKTLKPIIRIATEEDDKTHQENLEKKEKAISICEEKILNHGLDMKLVDMEYTFDNNKVIFYFTADGRIDFRELVRDLASHFKVRIELRQIGIRDQTKQVGGLGICGMECCCKRYMGDFAPISITMAKNQGMSLNPTKISGLCGRLLCCLRYENEFYEETLKEMPNIGDIIETPEGNATVIKLLPLSSEVRVILNKGSNEEKYTNFKSDVIKQTGMKDNDFIDFKDDNTEEIEEEVDIKKLED